MRFAPGPSWCTPPASTWNRISAPGRSTRVGARTGSKRRPTPSWLYNRGCCEFLSCGGWMPIYEYKCENGHVFDVMQKLSDDPLAFCMECDAPVRKVLHPVNISFKGSGFYSTDYKAGAKAEATSKNGESGEKGAQKKKDSSTEKASGKQD